MFPNGTGYPVILTLGFHHFPYVSGVFILPVRVLIWGPDQGFPLFACASQASFQRFPRLFFRLRLLRSWGWFFLCGEPVSTLEALRMQRRRSQGWVAPTPTLSHRLYPLLSLRQTPRQALPPGRHLGQLGRAKGGTPLRRVPARGPLRQWTLSGWLLPAKPQTVPDWGPESHLFCIIRLSRKSHR